MGTLKLAHLKLGVYFVGQSIHFSTVARELTSVSMIGAAATAVAKIEIAEVSIRGLKRIVYIFLVVSVFRTLPKLFEVGQSLFIMQDRWPCRRSIYLP